MIGCQAADAFNDLPGTGRILDVDTDAGDVIDLTSFAALQALFTPQTPGGDDTRIALDAGTFVWLEDVKPSHLMADDVLP
jgi:hypothetical protein